MHVKFSSLIYSCEGPSSSRPRAQLIYQFYTLQRWHIFTHNSCKSSENFAPTMHMPTKHNTTLLRCDQSDATRPLQSSTCMREPAMISGRRGDIGIPCPKSHRRMINPRTSLYRQLLTLRLPLSGIDYLTLAFIINCPSP
jgi:hypothetical protein